MSDKRTINDLLTEWKVVESEEKWAQDVKVKHGKMHGLLGLKPDQKISDFKGGAKAAVDHLVGKVGHAKAASMINFAANVGKDAFIDSMQSHLGSEPEVNESELFEQVNISDLKFTLRVGELGLDENKFAKGAALAGVLGARIAAGIAQPENQQALKDFEHRNDPAYHDKSYKPDSAEKVADRSMRGYRIARGLATKDDKDPKGFGGYKEHSMDGDDLKANAIRLGIDKE